MLDRNVTSSFKLYRFPFQLAIFGVFTRIVQILAILAALSLNNIFTTSAQIPQLIPAGLCIIGILIFVGIAEIQARRVIQRVDYRLASIQNVFGQLLSNSGLGKEPTGERQFLKQVILPLFMYLPSAPLTALALISTTPYLFILSAAQSLVNTLIIWHFNKSKALTSLSYAGHIDRKFSGNSDKATSPYLFRKFSGVQNQKTSFKAIGENDDSSYTLLNGNSSKRQSLSMSSTIFRAIFLIVSAILAIYKLASLSGIVGFFILNNTFKLSIISFAEFVFPSKRPLSLRQACLMTNLSLQSESTLIELKQHVLFDELQLRRSFTQRYNQRITTLPFIRLKDFSLVVGDEQKTTVIQNLTGRIELTKATLISIKGSRIATYLKDLIADRKAGNLHVKVQGMAVCSSMRIDLHFWNSLPILSPWDNRVVSTSLIDFFEPDMQPAVQKIIDSYRLDQYYVEDENQTIRVEDIGKRQRLRICALVSLIDLIVEDECLTVSPFSLDPFDESESFDLLRMVSECRSPNQKCIFLTSRSLKQYSDYRCYELSRSSLNKLA